MLQFNEPIYHFYPHVKNEVSPLQRPVLFNQAFVNQVETVGYHVVLRISEPVTIVPHVVLQEAQEFTFTAISHFQAKPS